MRLRQYSLSVVSQITRYGESDDDKVIAAIGRLQGNVPGAVAAGAMFITL